MDPAVETDGPEADQISAEMEALAVGTPVIIRGGIQQQQQPVKRVVGDDGREMVVLTAAQYDEIVQRPPVADWFYTQLDDERRQRLDITEKYRSCSEALARENHLVMRYRHLLIRNRLQPDPADGATDAISVGAELPDSFFKADRSGGEEFELRGRCLAESAGYSTEPVQTTEEPAPCRTEPTQKTPSEVHQSTLESDEAVVIARPVFTDARLPPSHDHRKSSSETVTVAAAADESRGPREQSRLHQQLLDEANDAMKTVPMPTASSMSHDLLQKVLEQNARLKLILKKIVDAQGMSVRDFLVSCSVCWCM